jgi:hypothetical protein
MASFGGKADVKKVAVNAILAERPLSGNGHSVCWFNVAMTGG